VKAPRFRLFNAAETMALAADVLSRPPVGTLPRIEPRGVLVHRFSMPLELCSPENRHSHGRAWSHAARKDELFQLMFSQHPRIRSAPLPGRPFIRQIRFSSREADLPSDGFKTPIDFLCVPKPAKKPGGRCKRGFGFLVDDAPRFVERAPAWWERVPPKCGFALLEIYTGSVQ